jgi:hypothetical protein
LQVFQNCHAAKYAATFRDHAQALAHQIPRTQTGNVDALVADAPSLGPHAPGDGFQGGGFARAVGANQADQLTRKDFQIHPFDRLDAAIGQR